MPFEFEVDEPTPDGVQRAFATLFQCAHAFVDRVDHAQDTIPEVAQLQKRLAESLLRRLHFLDSDSDTETSASATSAVHISMARALLFSDEDQSIMAQILDLLGASAPETRWFGANVDQANHFTKVLVGGNRTTYPDVDAPSYPRLHGAAAYARWLRGVLLRLREGSARTALRDRFAAVAEIQHVNDQGRLAPHLALQARENAAALAHARTLDYARWRFGALLVLGNSPTPAEAEAGTKCSQMTRDKLARAISLNTEHTGLAPLYIMCGGAVRPQLTRVNEAYEMKAYAVEKYGIPAEQILVDATSEHTYSNFMNAVLIARDAGMPRGTRLGVFMVPDRYGMDDQYAFCVNRLWARAKIEVFPPLGAYFSLEDGEEERAVELVLNTGPEDAEPEFVSPTLLWRDYTGELRAEG